MPKIIFTGIEENEQALGAAANNELMHLYLRRCDDPLNLISLNGHPISDAPEYALTETKIRNHYRTNANGRNILVEEVALPEIVNSITFTLGLPPQALSVTDRIYSAMNDGCEYDAFFLMSGCDDGCDEFAWRLEDVRFGAKQITNGVIVWGADGADITMTRSMRGVGNLLSLYGSEVVTLAPTAGATALYAITLIEDSCDAGCGCPYQNIARGGAALAQYSDDGGGTWTNYDATAVAADLVAFVVTDLIYSNGRLIGTYADVADADSTDGGIFTTFGTDPLVLGSLSSPSTGLQTVVKLGNKLYAFGDSGSGYVSCDNGLSWTALVTGITETIVDAAVDSENQRIILAALNGEVWVYEDGFFTDISANVPVVGGADILSVTVDQCGVYQVGDGNGVVYAVFGYTLTKPWVQLDNFGAAVLAMATDGVYANNLYGADTALSRISILSEMEREDFATTGGSITQIIPLPALDDETVTSFLLVTATGETVRISPCGLCIETGDCAS